MKILYIHQYFRTPNEPGGTRSYWLSKELIQTGYEVTMITSTNKYRNIEGRYNVEGIDVIYIKNEYDNYMSESRKIKSFISFVFDSIKVALKEKDVDLVFATSTPLTIGIIALFLNLFKGWKYVFEVRDLWPEFPIQMGAINNRLIILILRYLEKWIYKRAKYIIALSPGIQEGILKTEVLASKVSVIPNMSKSNIFYPREIRTDIVNKYSIDLEKINVIYFGSMGIANGLSYIMEAAKYLKEMNILDINFIILGDGGTRPKLIEFAIKYDLKNVKFLKSQDMNNTSDIVNCCDFSFICFKNISILYTNSPNKLFDSLSAGKPIIVNSLGWTKELIEENDCGFFVNPDSPDDFVRKILQYKDDKKQLDIWSKNARKLALNCFDKSILCKKFLQIINSVMNDK
jgi:glycosyltransferase involved in cell wall biosynthesis